jgi:hypothetical protein
LKGDQGPVAHIGHPRSGMARGAVLRPPLHHHVQPSDESRWLPWRSSWLFPGSGVADAARVQFTAQPPPAEQSPPKKTARDGLTPRITNADPLDWLLFSLVSPLNALLCGPAGSAHNPMCAHQPGPHQRQGRRSGGNPAADRSKSRCRKVTSRL